MKRDPGDAYWSFETASFLIAAYVDDEQMDPADQLDDEALADLRAGRSRWFCVDVEVTHLPSGRVVGRDSQGGCNYTTLAEFFESRCNPYWPQMVHEAVHQARAELARQRRPERLVDALVAAQEAQALFATLASWEASAKREA